MQPQFGLTFHHLGLAVRNEESARSFLAGMGYACGETVFDPLQNVHVAMCHHPAAPDVELISPGDGPGPLDRILKRDSERIYHLCFESENLGESLAAIEKAGLRALEVVPSKLAVLFDDTPVAFFYVTGFGIIEIIDLGA